MSSKQRRILVQRADRLGDVVLALPVLENIKAEFPNCQLDVLVSPIGAEFLKGHPLITNIHVLKVDNQPFFKTIKEGLSLIKPHQYDVYVSLWNHPTLAWLGFLARIPFRIGDSSNPSLKYLYNEPVLQKWENFTRHQAEFNLDLLKPLGILVPQCNASIHQYPSIYEKMKQLVDKFLPGKLILTIMCSTGGSNSPFPETPLLEFIQRVLDDGRYNIILLGQADQPNTLTALEKPGILNLIGRTKLHQLVELIRLSDVYVGPDTGATHIAGWMQKPVVVFSGKKNSAPSRWGPQTPYITILRKDFASDDRHAWLTADILETSFFDLIQRKASSLAFSRNRHRNYLLLKSVRILHIVRTKKEWRNMQETMRHLRKKGLIIFPFRMKPWAIWQFPKLLNRIRKHNINVLQGPFALPVVGLVRLWIGMVWVYIKPVWIAQNMNRHIDVLDYLEMYRDAWN